MTKVFRHETKTPAAANSAVSFTDDYGATHIGIALEILPSAVVVGETKTDRRGNPIQLWSYGHKVPDNSVWVVPFSHIIETGSS